eukprot:SAG11_NODE_723_length_7528_cov_4.998385_6_plen_102_part_00
MCIVTPRRGSFDPAELTGEPLSVVQMKTVFSHRPVSRRAEVKLATVRSTNETCPSAWRKEALARHNVSYTCDMRTLNCAAKALRLRSAVLQYRFCLAVGKL